jgi:putative DNA methylase
MSAPRRKLIEVALPLEAINREAAREKSIRHGHPSTLHLWWARRPLAAARAVIFAQMVDDPDSDPAYRRPDGSVDEDRAGMKRAELFNLIEELVKWENTNNDRVINAARAEIARCVASAKIEEGELQKATIIFGPGKGTAHSKGPLPQDSRTATAWEIVILRAKPDAVNLFLTEHAPPFHDPFAGGGALPLEAQRLGLIAHASDLNPVAVMINKAMIEIPPRFAGQPPINPEYQRKSRNEKAAQIWRGAAGLAEDVRYYGQWMRNEAEKRIGYLYPKVKVTAEMAKNRPDLKPYVGKELTVIAWLWARTVESSNPAYRGCHVPLVSSFWLSSKAGKETYIEPMIEGKSYRFEVRVGKPRDKATVDAGTKLSRGANFRCLLSQSPLSTDYIRGEFQAKRAGVRLMAIVAEGVRGRVYLSPQQEHEDVAASAKPHWLPEADMNQDCRDLVSGRGYGFTKWHEIFTTRQLVALTTLSDLVAEAMILVGQNAEVADVLPKDTSPLRDGGIGPTAYSEAVGTYLGLAVDKATDYNTTLVVWSPTRDQAKSTFARQALPMVWDFAEINQLARAAGDFGVSIEGGIRFLEHHGANAPGFVTQANAAVQTISKSKIVSTDPPYYDNIGYADLSDFFYIWLRRSLREVFPDLFSTLTVPKAEELGASAYRHGSREKAERFFLDGMTHAMHRLAEQANAAFPLTIYYAFKQSESESDLGTASTGWETFLDAMIFAGLSICGTWPMRTERGSRSIGIGTNALSSSIVLVCRPRLADAQVTTRKDFVTALRRELPPALRHLQHSNIAPVDLAQASIGPGMAVFSRYSRILESDGKSMTVRTALQLINQTLDETLAEQEGDFDPDSAWAVAWFEQFAFNDGPFGDAETLSKAKNTALNALATAGIVKTGAGKARLLRVDELPTDWNPATDARLTVWEMVHHLIRVMNSGGEKAAAELVAKLGGAADAARELAYRLYNVCERRKRAAEALAYNALVQSWPEISRLAREGGKTRTEQTQLFDQE